MRIRILVDGIDAGGGVAVAPHLVLTARHVVAGVAIDQLEILADGESVAVVDVVPSDDVDVALLHVDGSVAVAATCDAVDGDTWKVAAPPLTDLPYLSGIVTTATRDWRSADGRPTSAVQLGVNEDLQDFHGYSGSPVYLPEENDAVIGVLIEQQPVLLSRPGEAPPAANVLYAVPIQQALSAVGREEEHRHQRIDRLLPACLAYHDTVVATLRGYRSRLTSRFLSFVEPEADLPWSPSALWTSLCDPETSGMTLLTGYGGAGKTRTLLEVSRRALADGWQVIHVRGGNASRVADYLSERLTSSHASPILLVIDYLNVARELDLLSLAEIVGQHRTGSPGLSVLASSRTGWAQKHRHDAGMDRFTTVALDRTRDDTVHVCRAIIRQVAPRATLGVGVDTVLHVTGDSRPILAVLLGQIVEEQYVSNGSLPAALVSEDLAVWLDGRLREDDLLPQVAGEANRVEARLIGAAASLAGSPASRLAVIEAVAFATEEEGHPERSTYTVDKLRQIGWLLSSEDDVMAAHDVVADMVLEGVLFYDDGQGVRRGVVDRLLDIAFVNATVFANVVDSIERVLNERDSRSLESTSLVAATQAWLRSRVEQLLSGGPVEPSDTSKIAIRLMRSELFDLDEADNWTHLIHPLLDRLGTSAAAAEPLLAACLLMPRHVERRIVDQALTWLANRAAATDEQLIIAVLLRKDLDEQQARSAIDTGLAWVDALADRRVADMVLIRLLGRPEATGPQLERLTELLVGWVGDNDTTWGAPRLLKSALERPGVGPTASVRLAQSARAWLENNPTLPASSYLLQWLLGSVTPEDEDSAWQSAERWLDANPVGPGADFVLQAMFTWPGLTEVRGGVAWRAAVGWLDTNLASPHADHLLQAMLQWPRLTDEQATATWDAAIRWLDGDPTRVDAAHLLEVLLAWPGLNPARAQVLWERVADWLLAHAVRPDANFLLQALLNWPELSQSQTEATWAAVETWLDSNKEKVAANFLLQALLGWSGLSGARAAVTWGAVESWLAVNGDHVEASFLLQSLLTWSGLSDARADVTWAAAKAWLALDSSQPDADFLLRTLLGWSGLSGERADAAWSAVEAWLARYSEWPDAQYLLQALVAWSGLSGARSEVAWAAAGKWLAVHQERLDAHYLFKALFRWWGLLGERAEITWAATQGWLAAYERRPEAQYLLQALLGWSGLSGARAERAWAAAEAWLTVYEERADAQYLLQALLRWPDLSGERADFTWEAVRAWLHVHGSAPDGRHAVESLLVWSGLSDDRAEVTWEAAEQWLVAHSDRPDARYLLQALVEWSGLSGERADVTWVSVEAWLAVHGERPEAQFLLQALVEWSGLSGERAEVTCVSVEAWLTANAERPDAQYLLQALLRWSGPPKVLADVLSAGMAAWLAVNALRVEARHLLTAVLSRSDLSGVAAESTLVAALKWLDANASQPAATFVLQAVMERPDIPGSIVQPIEAAIAVWLDANAERDEATMLLQRVLQWPMASPDMAEVAWTGACTWLRINADKPLAIYLYRTLLRWPHLDEARVEYTRSSAVVWLARNASRPEAQYLLRALLAVEELAPEELATLDDAANIWLAVHGHTAVASLLKDALDYHHAPLVAGRTPPLPPPAPVLPKVRGPAARSSR